MKPTFGNNEQFAKHAANMYGEKTFHASNYFVITLYNAAEAGYIQTAECVGEYKLTIKGAIAAAQA